MKVIDLFAGCGGLSLGFIQNGYEINKAVEFDSSIANTYKLNHPEVDVIVDDIKKYRSFRYLQTRGCRRNNWGASLPRVLHGRSENSSRFYR